VQCKILPETSSSGTDTQPELIEAMEKEIETRIREEYERKMAAKKRLALNMPQDSSGGADESSGPLVKPKPLLTTKNPTMKMEFTEELVAHKSPTGSGGTGFSFREQSNIDYLLNRDPMKEFFSLTCQSIKLNSPHMNTICTIDTEQLYIKANKMNIPFFKWASWIEDFLNKEFLRAALKKSRRNGISSKPNTKTFLAAEKITQQKLMDQAKFF
jgi:hypothetical protein